MNNYEDVISNEPLSKETIKWARKSIKRSRRREFFQSFLKPLCYFNIHSYRRYCVFDLKNDEWHRQFGYQCERCKHKRGV